MLDVPRMRPALDWPLALARQRQLMRALPVQVLREDWMFYDASRGRYRDAGDRYSRTLV